MEPTAVDPAVTDQTETDQTETDQAQTDHAAVDPVETEATPPRPIVRPFAALETPTGEAPTVEVPTSAPPYPVSLPSTLRRHTQSTPGKTVVRKAVLTPKSEVEADYAVGVPGAGALGSRIRLGEVRLPPKGWVSCLEARDPGCAFGAVEMSEARWDDLGRAQSLNGRWRYRRDEGEDWRSPVNAVANSNARPEGDCEDAALAKLVFLRDQGWPEEALRIAVGKRDGVQHAALMVRTTLCDMILDNEGPVQCASKSRFRAEKINVGPFWRAATDVAETSAIVPVLF